MSATLSRPLRSIPAIILAIPLHCRHLAMLSNCLKQSASICLLSATLLMASTPTIGVSIATAQEVPIVGDVDRQPFEAAVGRVVQALQLAGSPLSADTLNKINELRQSENDPQVIRELQLLLDPQCLTVVTINPESRVKVAMGPAKAVLDKRG